MSVALLKRPIHCAGFGTTAYELARVIKRTFRSLTVVTNSIAILNELADAKGITLIALGVCTA